MSDETASPSVSPNLIDVAFASNISSMTPALDTSAENYMVVCDGARYGFNPNIADCEGAVQSIDPDSDQMVWGERHSRLPVEYFPLPFAVFGDKAECAIRTILHGDSPTALASFSQVKSAAAALNLQCAAGGQSQGGIITNIGGDNNLAVVLSTYEPNIRCSTTATFDAASSCGSILADMPASTEKLLFGPETAPGVQEQLPQLLASSKLSPNAFSYLSFV
ncbi:hypothetical protein IMSHALPRED_003232 [Imshaugia aleurites]|uniref:Uncharacterized protein n=1 Tax=Imshaugia aleurites TaxID=172621 RepID=A0A8H3IFE8_9LECA|nr:hypothetical protein IMSHALPRED_003232 [Imshaugia aleurites]